MSGAGEADRRYLADKSAVARFKFQPVGDRLAQLRAEDRLYSCPIIDLEILFSAKGPMDYAAISSERREGFPQALMDALTFDRTLQVQALLAERNEHRAVPIPDLLVAATAERAEMTVLHYDRDFDRIAAVTGQPVEWVVDRRELGSQGAQAEVG